MAVFSGKPCEAVKWKNLIPGKCVALSNEYTDFQAPDIFEGKSDSEIVFHREHPAWLMLELGEGTVFDKVVIREAKAGDGYRVQSYKIQYSEDTQKWTDVLSADEVGARKEHTFNPVTARYVRLLIQRSLPNPNILEFGVYDTGKEYAQEIDENGTAAPVHILSQQERDRSKNRYFTVRSSMANSFLKFSKEKKGQVAFLGGSITKMTGWRDLICVYLVSQFPDTEFSFINAGIGSTDTAFGAYRLEEDCFKNGPVDLLFVEFAVNDEANERTGTESIRGMEGIIRKARGLNPSIDIIMMHFADPAKIQAINKGDMSNTIRVFEEVAEHYQINSIDLAKEIAQRIKNNEFSLSEFGGTHPSPFGHELYRSTIQTFLEKAWGSTESDREVLHEIPGNKMDNACYDNGDIIDIRAAEIESGWILDPDAVPKMGTVRVDYSHIPMLVAEQPGARLKIEFEGRGIGVLFVSGPDAGILEFRIDGGEAKKQDLFNSWSDHLNLPWVYMLDAELKSDKHVLELRVSDEKNAKSNGNAARIIKFLVNR